MVHFEHESKETEERLIPKQVVQLQMEMKQIVETQLKQQQEFLNSQKKKGKDELNPLIPLLNYQKSKS